MREGVVVKYGKVLLVIITCLSIFLVGCNKQDGIVVKGDYYSIERQNGNYYMSFAHDKLDDSYPTCPDFDFMNYSNVEEMAKVLLENKLTLHEVKVIIQQYADIYRNKYDRIQIVNVEELYEPASVDGWNVGKVYWFCDRYSFTIKNGDMTAAFAVCTKEGFEKDIQENKAYESAKVSQYVANGVKYTLVKIYYQDELSSFRLYGEQDNVYFIVNSTKISEEMLTNDFVSQFRLKKHN